MRFECRSIFYPKPLEPDDYIRPHDVSVICSTSDEEVIAARLAVDYLDILRAEIDGESVCDVCDADSAGWKCVSCHSGPTHRGIDFSSDELDAVPR